MCGRKLVYMEPNVLRPCIFDQVFIWAILVNTTQSSSRRRDARTFNLIATHVYSHWRLIGYLMSMKCSPFRGQVDGPVEVKKSTIASRPSFRRLWAFAATIKWRVFSHTHSQNDYFLVQVSTIVRLDKLYCILEDIT